MLVRPHRLGVVVVMAIAALAGCDSTIGFHITNDSPDYYFARVTNDQGDTYVHEVGPSESGYAAQGVVPGPPGPDYRLELLDTQCAVVETWSMPSDGGHLEIGPKGDVSFTAGYYFEPIPTGETPPPAPTDDPFPTVMGCGATDVLGSAGAPNAIVLSQAP